MTTTAPVPVAPGLFTSGDEPQLIGSTCADCGVMTFPKQADCPRCTGDRMEEALFARRGTLWTFTTQQFIPKSPPYAIVETEETFVPYGVGYVEFEGQARVEGRLTEADPSKLRIGMEMETVVVPLMDGVVTYAFRPVAAGEDS
jgi:uncharacterized OB-fold protein